MLLLILAIAGTDVAEIVRDLSVAFAAVVGATIGLWFTYRRTGARDRMADAAIQQAQATHEQYRILQHQLEVSSRQSDNAAKVDALTTFSRAVDLLGDERKSARVGGLRLLSQLAIDFPQFHSNAVEVMVEYIREHAGRRRVELTERDMIQVQEAVANIREENPTFFPSWSGFTDYDTMDDVRIAVRLIALSKRSETGYPRYPKLQMLDLRGIALVGLDLRGFNFRGADLTGARLENSTFSEAWFFAADLTDAYLQDACLDAADLRLANLTGANLCDTSLRDANLEDAQMSGTFLHGADLAETKGLTQEQLNGAYGDETTLLPGGMAIPHTPFPGARSEYG